jgi:hypothetical protein
MSLEQSFPIHGHEIDIAQGISKYMNAVKDDTSTEGIEWARTLRSGRMDTDDVKNCVATLCNYIVNTAQLEPLDPARFFTRVQRAEILSRAKGHCQNVLETGQRCNSTLSPINFHADHITPWSQSGKTTTDNGQALCSG